MTRGAAKRCPRCLSEMLLMFQFYRCASGCDKLSTAEVSALRRRNAGIDHVDLEWEGGE